MQNHSVRQKAASTPQNPVFKIILPKNPPLYLCFPTGTGHSHLHICPTLGLMFNDLLESFYFS